MERTPTMKARISNLHKTESEWKKLSSFVPEAGELIIYDSDENFNYARIKVGDGTRTLQELDFLIRSATTDMLSEYKYSEIIDSGRITDKR